MLGFAANCKNEGVALLVAVTIAMVAEGYSGPMVNLIDHAHPACNDCAPWPT